MNVIYLYKNTRTYLSEKSIHVKQLGLEQQNKYQIICFILHLSLSIPIEIIKWRELQFSKKVTHLKKV